MWSMNRPPEYASAFKKEDKRMERFFGKIRPQIFLSIVLLGIISIVGMLQGLNEVTVGCVAGIIALSKDVLQSDS